MHGAQCVAHTLPNGGLGLGGDLLTDDVVHHCGEQVRIHRAVHRSYAVDHLCQALVLLPQKIKFFFAVSKIHGFSPITFDFCLCLYKFFLFLHRIFSNFLLFLALN